jgi:hypothetical protein
VIDRDIHTPHTDPDPNDQMHVLTLTDPTRPTPATLADANPTTSVGRGYMLLNVRTVAANTRPDQTIPDQIKPDQTRPDQIRPDQIRPDHTKPRRPLADANPTTSVVRSYMLLNVRTVTADQLYDTRPIPMSP